MKRVSVICLVGLLAVVFLFAACGPEVTPAKPEKVIRFGALPDLTGPYAIIVDPIFKGGRDYVRYLNEEQGGIDGIKAEISWVDQRSNPAICVSSYRRMKAEGVVGMWLFTSTDATAVRPYLDTDKIPGGGTASATSLFVPAGYLYTSYVHGTQSILVGAEWYLGEFKKKGIDRPMRLAILGWDNPYGREGLEPLIPWAREQGVEVVDALWVSPMAMDYGVQFTRLKSENPDVVFAICNGGFACRDAARAGLPEDVPIIFCTGSIEDPGYVALAGAGIAHALSTDPLWSTSEDKPIITLGKELYLKYHSETVHEVPLGWLGGWQSMALLCEGARQAVDKVGYENLTGAAVAEAIFGLEDWEGAMTGAPISFTDYTDDRIGQETYRVWQYDMAAKWWVPISDWLQAPSFPDILSKYVGK